MSDILIRCMEMPKNCEQCWFFGSDTAEIGYCYLLKGELPMPDGVPQDCPLIEIPPHGRLIDAEAMIADLKRQCKEVFRIDAVSPDDFWITRNQAFNERLWTTWCESLFAYLKSAPTVIPASFENLPKIARCSQDNAADAVEELQKDIERSKSFEAFWQQEAEEALRRFQVAVANKPQWIPVTERLPSENDRYLTVSIEPWFGTTVVDTMRWSGVWMYDGRQTESTVTHWMPLPEPPESEGE